MTTEFGELDLSVLSLDATLENAIQQRIEEIQKTLAIGAPLSTVLLSGSALEGILLNAANKNPQQFNTAAAAPSENGKVRDFSDWTLNNLIDVAYEIELISLDVKNFSHPLRDFRNYIHPRQQVKSQFQPDIHTAKISWQVLQAVIANLSGKR